MRAFQTRLRSLWLASPPLTAAGLLMLAALAGAAIGLVLDPRLVTGAPAWLKPAKFASSTAIYAFTLAWIFTHLDGWTRVKRWVGWITAIVFVVEVAIIDVQAARGVSSHFNVGTAVDGVLFTVMGSAILLVWVTSIVLTVAVFRHRFADRALGWAFRLGLLITVLGAATGGLMTRPTPAQLEAARTGRMTVAGAHTVGAPDGGPGLPGTGWSREHGDLRVPHFLGLHGMQFVPLMALLLGGVQSRRRRQRLVIVGGASYGAMFGILLSQALRGQSATAPDSLTLALLAGWAAVTVAAAAFAARECTGRLANPLVGAAVTPDTLFQVCNPVAAAGWLALLLALQNRRPASAAATFGGIVIPLSLAVVYAVVLASNIVGAPGGFSSLQEVADLVLQSLAAARGLGALPRVRSVHRRVGGSGCHRARRASTAGRPVPGPDVSLRPDRLALLPRRPIAPEA